MSLVRLLSAGKSLVGGQDWASRYRAAGEGMLPKFGSAKNPFRTTAKPGLAETGVRPPAERQSAPYGQPPATPCVGPVAEACPEPGAAAARERTKQEAPAAHDRPNRERQETTALRRPPGSAAPTAAGQLAGSVKKLAESVMSRLGRPTRKAPKGALPQLSAPTVQGELSLDRVRVVRNDLSDSDLEIVPVKAPSNVPVALPAVPKIERTETAWGRMAGRVFAAEKS